jgi:hypothetical protein
LKMTNFPNIKGLFTDDPRLYVKNHAEPEPEPADSPPPCAPLSFNYFDGDPRLLVIWGGGGLQGGS